MAELQPKVTSSGGQFDLAALTDGDLAKSTLLPAAPGRTRSLDPVRIRRSRRRFAALTLVTAGGGRGGARRRRQRDRAGIERRRRSNFAPLSRFPRPARAPSLFRRSQPGSSVSPSRLRHRWRAVPAPASHRLREAAMPAPPPEPRSPNWCCTPAQRVNRFEDKAAFSAATNLYAFATPAGAGPDAVCARPTSST